MFITCLHVSESTAPTLHEYLLLRKVPSAVCCSQVPVRHVRSGQHATVALHPCDLPLHPSPATQHFSQPPHSGNTSLSAATAVDHTVHSSSPGACDQQQSRAQQQQQQLELHEEKLLTHQQQRGQIRQHNLSQEQLNANGMAATDPELQTAAAAQQVLPAGLMALALQKQFQPPAQPWPQQQDRYVLDHRIHCAAAAEQPGRQQASATAVGQAAWASRSAAPITVPVMTGTSNGHVGSLSGSPVRGGAVSSSPVMAGLAPPNTRKGMVLLDVQTNTCTVWEFEAVIVLLNGHWPPRGLLSGRWPPKPDTPDTVLSTSMSDCPLGEDVDPAWPASLQTHLATVEQYSHNRVSLMITCERY